MLLWDGLLMNSFIAVLLGILIKFKVRGTFFIFSNITAALEIFIFLKRCLAFFNFFVLKVIVG
jgi:hypothetical protein